MHYRLLLYFMSYLCLNILSCINVKKTDFSFIIIAFDGLFYFILFFFYRDFAIYMLIIAMPITATACTRVYLFQRTLMQPIKQIQTLKVTFWLAFWLFFAIQLFEQHATRVYHAIILMRILN